MLRTYSTVNRSDEATYVENLKTANERLKELELRLKSGLGLVENQLLELRRGLEAQSTLITDIQSRVDCHTEIILGVRTPFPFLLVSDVERVSVLGRGASSGFSTIP